MTKESRSKTAELFIAGHPVGKGRPKISTLTTKKKKKIVRAYTPKRTADYEKMVQAAYLIKYGEGKLFGEVPLEMEIEAVYAVPKSYTKKRTEKCIKGLELPTKKPDADNIIKVIADALNKIMYPDDRFITKVSITKRYICDPSDEEEGVCVRLAPIGLDE